VKQYAVIKEEKWKLLNLVVILTRKVSLSSGFALGKEGQIPTAW
jgi:hypothetical protein